MTNNNLSIASLLRDDKSKMATLIACGASAVALIYYNREVRNQIANIFMVRFLLLLFVAVVFRWSSFIIIIIISLMMMMMVMTMPLLVCERKTTRLIFRECWYCARWTTRVVTRERGRWRVDKPEKRDWIFGSKFSLAAVIISSFHLHRRGFFFLVLMWLSLVRSHKTREVDAYALFIMHAFVFLFTDRPYFSPFTIKKNLIGRCGGHLWTRRLIWQHEQRGE